MNANKINSDFKYPFTPKSTERQLDPSEEDSRGVNLSLTGYRMAIRFINRQTRKVLTNDYKYFDLEANLGI